jgi:Rhodopirellula transposase DDE domain
LWLAVGVTRIGDDTVGFLRQVFEAAGPHLDEKARRLVAGAAAGALGHGGIAAASRASGLSPGAVSDGMWELAEGRVAAGRVRREGAGRKPAAERDPGLVPAMLGLVEPARRGDPMGPSCWTTLSTRDLAGELTAAGHPAAHSTVGDLLRANGFVLRGNAKVLEGSQHPDRDGQFRHINDTAALFLAAGDPVVSIDAKKKEMIGDFANPGRTWHRDGEPVKVRDHSFVDAAEAVAIPFGVYDVGANTGWVNVGIDHNTAAFVVQSLRRWWDGCGCRQYPRSGRLLVCADAGKPNAVDSWLFKAELAAFAAETGLDVTVVHYPPGTSKWNKIEHRLFSAITMNWRGRPLTSLQVVVETIAATTNASGLTVTAALDAGAYPTGREVTKAQRAALPLDRHDWHGDWNYTLRHVEGWTLPEPAAGAARPPRPSTAWLAHPAITGLTTADFNALATALYPAPPATRRPDSRRLPAAADRLLVTILTRHHKITQVAAATLLGANRQTIANILAENDRRLAATGRILPTPPTAPLRTLDALAAAIRQTSTT